MCLDLSIQLLHKAWPSPIPPIPLLILSGQGASSQTLETLWGSVKNSIRTSLVVQWPRLHAPNAEGLGSIPGQGARSQMPQLRVRSHRRSNILHATTKTSCNQINKNKLKKKNGILSTWNISLSAPVTPAIVVGSTYKFYLFSNFSHPHILVIVVVFFFFPFGGTAPLLVLILSIMVLLRPLATKERCMTEVQPAKGPDPSGCHKGTWPNPVLTTSPSLSNDAVNILNWHRHLFSFVQSFP